MPLLDGKMHERPKPIGFWHPDGDEIMRYNLHKRSKNKYELYDLSVDSSEKKDLAARHPEIVARMKAELERWQQSVQRNSRGEDYPNKPALQPKAEQVGKSSVTNWPTALGQFSSGCFKNSPDLLSPN